MTDNNRSSDSHRALRGAVSLEDRLDAMEDKIDKLLEGQSTTATISLRLRALEVIVYGACGLGLMAIVSALLYLVIKQH